MHVYHAFLGIPAVLVYALATSTLLAAPIHFSTLPMSGPNTSSLFITFDAGLLGTSTDSSSVSASGMVTLGPGTEPFTTAHVATLDMTMNEAMNFSLAGGLLRMNTSAGNFMVSMTTPGPMSVVNHETFTQTGNTFQMNGIVSTSFQGNIDLSRENSFVDDLPNVTLTQQGDQITMAAPFHIVQDTVVENVPFLGNVPITITTTGTIRAVGTAVPEAGHMEWDGTSSSEGLAGDGVSWSNGLNWSREGIPDRSFVTNDQVTFRNGSSQTMISLQGNRQVDQVHFEESYTLNDNTLMVASGNIDVDEGVVVTLNSTLATGNDWISKAGTGKLFVNGNAPDILVISGTLGGHGSVGNTVLTGDATLAPGGAVRVSLVPEPNSSLLLAMMGLMVLNTKFHCRCSRDE